MLLFSLISSHKGAFSTPKFLKSQMVLAKRSRAAPVYCPGMLVPNIDIRSRERAPVEGSNTPRNVDAKIDNTSTLVGAIS